VNSEPLNRFLVRRLRVTWATAHGLIHEGRVAVDGVVVRHYRRSLGLGVVVTMGGVVVADGPDDLLLVCHKPVGVACSHDPVDAPLLYDQVPEALRHPDLQTVGRLDRKTSGLLLLAVDGQVLNRLANPKSKLPKRYQVTYAGELPAEAEAQVAAGLVLADTGERCLPAELSRTKSGRCTLVLHEGKYHQVKRMLLTLGARVEVLHRDRIGGLNLPANLPVGSFRPLTDEEWALLT